MTWHLFFYACLCLPVAFYGRGTRLGFWGILLVSFFFTPWLVGLGLIFLAPFNSNLIFPFKPRI